MTLAERKVVNSKDPYDPDPRVWQCPDCQAPRRMTMSATLTVTT